MSRPVGALQTCLGVEQEVERVWICKSRFHQGACLDGARPITSAVVGRHDTPVVALLIYDVGDFGALDAQLLECVCGELGRVMKRYTMRSSALATVIPSRLSGVIMGKNKTIAPPSAYDLVHKLKFLHAAQAYRPVKAMSVFLPYPCAPDTTKTRYYKPLSTLNPRSMATMVTLGSVSCG